MAKLLKSTPLLKHFIECDENGEPIKPYVKTNSEIFKDNHNLCRVISKEERQFIIAQKQVLFEAEIENMDNGNSYILCNGIVVFYKDSDMDNKWYLLKEFTTYSDLTKYQLQTNNNFKELIYGK